MFSLNLPDFQVKIAVTDGKKMVFRPPAKEIRRPNSRRVGCASISVHFLIQHKGYPSGPAGQGGAAHSERNRKRCDTVLYDRTRTPRMIIEYKAPTVPITRQVFDQITRYNIVLKVDYLIVSNGLEHYCCKVDYERFCCNFLKEIPDYAMLQTL